MPTIKGKERPTAPTKPTSANPLGSLWACHEDHGLEMRDQEASAAAIENAHLVTFFVYTPTLLTPESKEARTIRDLAAQAGVMIVTALHHRCWFHFDLDPHTGETSIEAAVVERSSWDPDQFVSELVAADVSFDYFEEFEPGEEFADLRKTNAKAVRAGSCSKMRWGESSDPYKAWSPAACDPAELSIDWMRRDFEHVNSQRLGWPAMRLLRYGPPLGHIGVRDGNRRALIAANICDSLPPDKAAAALGDLLAGNL